VHKADRYWRPFTVSDRQFEHSVRLEVRHIIHGHLRLVAAIKLELAENNLDIVLRPNRNFLLSDLALVI
jgi:hypothetical protein